MKDIYEYIKIPQQDRQNHLKMDEPCIERGGPHKAVSSYCKGLLAHILDTTIPSGMRIYVCHACHNWKCSNPYHLYWGTPRENRLDGLANGSPSAWQHVVNKYGIEEAKRIMTENGKKNKGSKAP